ncbi:hypothetical protein EI555_012367 [Monodon monoceros]|uniref:Uncharacterized protein n=1 Tax=Monodon monoceros TaxID=40151 RepID=A0A4U1ER70_MONMO|nr:hypothetical protein EI555_012367 [Monodon monoceros]
MHGAFGKPEGTGARVHVGQVIMCVRTKLQNKEHVIEALHRAKFKFPGHHKIHISKKRGYTKVHVDEFENMVAEKQLMTLEDCGVEHSPSRGPGHMVGPALLSALTPCPPYSCPPVNPISLSRRTEKIFIKQMFFGGMFI